jgi:hypothetical protein
VPVDAGRGGDAGRVAARDRAGRRPPLTAQPTVGHNYTAEPTALTVIEQFFVPQFMGAFVKQYPLGLEPDTDLSGGTVKALALRINVSANVNALAYIRFGIGG